MKVKLGRTVVSCGFEKGAYPGDSHVFYRLIKVVAFFLFFSFLFNHLCVCVFKKKVCFLKEVKQRSAFKKYMFSTKTLSPPYLPLIDDNSVSLGYWES